MARWQKRSPGVTQSKGRATRSDGGRGGPDGLFLSMVPPRTGQPNGKSVTAGARNKFNPNAASTQMQLDFVENVLTANVWPQVEWSDTFPVIYL